MPKLSMIIALTLTFAAQAKKTAPSYTVPLKDESLKTWAKFDVPDAKFRIQKGLARMTYRLPEFLSGDEKIRVSAEGKKDPNSDVYKLDGKLGDMECTVSGNLAECHITYHRDKLPVLSEEGGEAVREFIEDTVDDESERENRLEVFKQFSHEAAGDCHAIPVKR